MNRWTAGFLGAGLLYLIGTLIVVLRFVKRVQDAAWFDARDPSHSGWYLREDALVPDVAMLAPLAMLGLIGIALYQRNQRGKVWPMATLSALAAVSAGFYVWGDPTMATPNKFAAYHATEQPTWILLTATALYVGHQWNKHWGAGWFLGAGLAIGLLGIVNSLGNEGPGANDFWIGGGPLIVACLLGWAYWRRPQIEAKPDGIAQ